MKCAREIVIEMEIKPKFHEKYIILGNKQFDENVDNEMIKSL